MGFLGLGLLQLTVCAAVDKFSLSRSQVCWYAIIISGVIQPHNHDSSRTNSMREFIWRRESFGAFRAICLPAIITAIVHKKREYVITQVLVYVSHVEEKNKKLEERGQTSNFRNVCGKQTNRRKDGSNLTFTAMKNVNPPPPFPKKRPSSNCPPADCSPS